MATFNAENRKAWQYIADEAKADYPAVGKTVKIVGGRKYRGQVGIVNRHIVNKFYSRQYKSDAQLALMEINGREGYSVLVHTADGLVFWVPAEYTEVVEA